MKKRVLKIKRGSPGRRGAGRYFLVTFHPLCSTPNGRRAAETYALPPFTDGSCRREPDLESRYPSISALCRAGKFAPKLRQKDKVFYMSVCGTYGGVKGWALVAALEVKKVFPSHEKAARWYSERGLPLPSNCMVSKNPCLPLEKTTGLPAAGAGMQQAWNQEGVPPATLCAWNAHYQARADKYPHFIATVPITLRLNDPPIVPRELLSTAFLAGNVPGTQSFKELTEGEFASLLQLQNGS